MVCLRFSKCYNQMRLEWTKKNGLLTEANLLTWMVDFMD